MKLFFSSPCLGVERLECLFCVTVPPGSTWYKDMGQWFPKLHRLSFELVFVFEVVVLVVVVEYCCLEAV